MTPISAKIHRLVAVSGLFLIALLMAACEPTRPPNIGMDDASRLLADARSAGAPTYAPQELRNAEDRLSQARARFDKNDFEQAARYTQESRADSELALVKSRLGKARERADQRARENAQLQQDTTSGAVLTPTGDVR